MSATFILDGSNLAWLGPGDGPALAPVDAIADALRAEWPGCKVIALCDASLRHRLSPTDKAEHNKRTAAGDLVEAPADEDADGYILESARRLGGCVVTRDLYRDRREARAGVPMLRPALVGGAVILGDPKVFATADSERGEALPADALGPRVPPSPLPGGEPAPKAEEVTEPEPDAVAAQPDPPPAADVTSTAQAEPEAAAEPEPEPEPEPKPKPRKRASRSSKASAKPARSKAATAKPKSSARSRSRAKKAPPKADPPTAATAIGAVILLSIFGAIGGLVWWLTGSDEPSAAEPVPGVLFARNCKGWTLAGGQERIVFHARPDQCATSIAALDAERFLVTIAEGEAPRTIGAVRLVTADAGGEISAIELTRGRPGAGDVPPERATARIVGVDAPARRVALMVSPGESRPPIQVVRAIGGDVAAHTEQAVGLALAPGRAAVLRHHCPAGCGTVHIATDISAALGAAEAASAPDAAGAGATVERWAGPAAFSPDGRRLAVAEAFVDTRGGVLVIDTVSGERTRLPFEARDQGEVVGIAWTAEGIFLGASGALYRTDPSDAGAWHPVSREPESVAPAAR